jgi:hypothetical protein
MTTRRPTKKCIETTGAAHSWLICLFEEVEIGEVTHGHSQQTNARKSRSIIHISWLQVLKLPTSDI